MSQGKEEILKLLGKSPDDLSYDELIHKLISARLLNKSESKLTPEFIDQWIKISQLELEDKKIKNELQIRREEIETKAKENKGLSAGYAAIFAAILGFFTSSFVTFIQGKSNLELENTKFDANQKLEQTKFETGLISKAIEPKDEETRLDLLRFYIDAGLISNSSNVENLRKLIADRKIPQATGLSTNRDVYGVIKGNLVNMLFVSNNKKLQLHLKCDKGDYRIAVNLSSARSSNAMLFALKEGIDHPTLNKLQNFPLGFIPLEYRKPNSLAIDAIDYVRSGIVDPMTLKPMSANEIVGVLNKYLNPAIKNNNFEIVSYGRSWGPEDKKDAFFGFLPGQGLHDIHLNQGITGKFNVGNGVWQDGAIFIRDKHLNKWVGFFFAYQDQSIHTDDKTGQPL